MFRRHSQLKMNSTYDAVFKVIETDVEILAKAINQAIRDSDEVQILNDFLTELKSLLDDANNKAVKIIRIGTDQQDSIIERLKTLKVLYRTIQLRSKRYERTLNNTATSSLNSSRVASNVSTPSIIRQALENLPLRRQTESLTHSTTTQNVTMDQDTRDDLPQFSGLPAILNATSNHRSNSTQDNSGLLLRPGSNSDASTLDHRIHQQQTETLGTQTAHGTHLHPQSNLSLQQPNADLSQSSNLQPNHPEAQFQGTTIELNNGTQLQIDNQQLTATVGQRPNSEAQLHETSQHSNPGTQIQVFNQQMKAPTTRQRNVSAPIFLPTATSKAAQSQMFGHQITHPILALQTASPPHGLYQPLSQQQNQPSSQQQRTHNPNSAFRPILTIENQNSTNHPPTNVFSGHQTTAKGITNINGVTIPAQPALLPTNQGDQRTATNWTSSQPTLTHQCTQTAIRSYQEGFLGTTTAYNPKNMPKSSTTAFTHAGCRGPTGTTHPNINMQHINMQHIRTSRLIFQFRPTLEQRRQTTTIIKRSLRHSGNQCPLSNHSYSTENLNNG